MFTCVKAFVAEVLEQRYPIGSGFSAFTKSRAPWTSAEHVKQSVTANMASTAPLDDHSLPPKCRVCPTIYEGSVMSTPSLNELEMLPHARIGVSTTGRIDFIHRALPFPPLPPPFDDPSTTTIRASSEKNQFFFPGFVGNEWLNYRTLPTTT